MLDVGVDTTGFVPDDGCDAVDFLFVVDNSGSMHHAQENLLANFPTFIGGIQSTLSGVESYHVGVVTTDAYAANTPGCTELGDLVVQTGGRDSSEAVCGPFAEGRTFMTEKDDLPASFACAAKVGTEGHMWERPMNAMEQALAPTSVAPGGCNEGFLRDDALLVVVVLTDEADGPGDPEKGAQDGSSEGDPDSWYASIVAAKLGVPENAVALVLAQYAGGTCEPLNSSYDGMNLVEFAQRFGSNGFVGGICNEDYGPDFEQAVAVVAAACEDFVPPG